MKKKPDTVDDTAIERAFGAILLSPSLTEETLAPRTAPVPVSEVPELLMDPCELISPTDRLEVDIEIGIPDRASLVEVARHLLSDNEESATQDEDVANVVGLAAALASRLRFAGGIPCLLRPDDADAIGLGVAEFKAANFGIRAAAASPQIVAERMGPYVMTPARADMALFVATAAHYRIGVAPVIGIALRLLLRLLRLLWRMIRNLFRFRKRLKAAKRLRARWARDLAAGTMSRAAYLKKLAGLIEELSRDIAVLVTLISEIADEIKKAESELEDMEDSEEKRNAEKALRELRERLENLRREKEALEEEKRAAERERDEAQQQDK